MLEGSFTPAACFNYKHEGSRDGFLSYDAHVNILIKAALSLQSIQYLSVANRNTTLALFTFCVNNKDLLLLPLAVFFYFFFFYHFVWENKMPPHWLHQSVTQHRAACSRFSLSGLKKPFSCAPDTKHQLSCTHTHRLFFGFTLGAKTLFQSPTTPLKLPY